MSTWKPKETAPNLEHVLAFEPEACPEVFAAYYDKCLETWLYADELLNEVDPEGPSPTHWMPLPEPPK